MKPCLPHQFLLPFATNTILHLSNDFNTLLTTIPHPQHYTTLTPHECLHKVISYKGASADH